MKVVTAAQMAAIEQAADRSGVTLDTLMENAGLAVAQAARDDLGGVAGARVVILVGPGNNGADGLVVARHLRRWGAEVACCLLTRRPEHDPKLDLAREYGVQILVSPDGDTLQRLLRRSRMVIDAILGTGRSRPLDGPVRDAMLTLQRIRPQPGHPELVEGPPLLLALDLPTGLNPDTGKTDPACPRFDTTLALGYPKIGLLRFPGVEHAGRLRVLDIGIPPGLPEEQSIDVEMLTSQWVASQLPPRNLDSHKGTYGHALVVAGSRHYVGAAWLASQASVRTGAGLTTLASPESVYPIAAAKGVEAIHLPLPEDDSGRIAPSAVSVIRQSERRFTAVLSGCGMGWSEGATEFLRLLLRETQDKLAGLPLLIDADGLNNLSAIENWPSQVNGPLVLTPHPGEMSTLTGLPVAEIQADREGVAREWAGRWGATFVLKGAHTVIASPGEPVRIAPFANPGLATGGTGDVLSGVIVSLLAQGLPPSVAAAAGVYLHAAAGQSVTDRIGQTGLAASDLLDSLPPTIAALHRATPDSAHLPS
ncbi:MAG: NAD(P)H-hydrate dehydratase [Chloroflexi bacterium]|nr:NAD(P)H-hydrate dehydratase [Chloroflexota bacterium]MYE41925.1 NAD(P)H-hydrate dehydratase [Chloroflexota bacterium]